MSALPLWALKPFESATAVSPSPERVIGTSGSKPGVPSGF